MEFTEGQFARMRGEVVAGRPTLAYADWDEIFFTNDLVIGTNQTYTFYDVDVRMGLFAGINVFGELNAEGTTFTESSIGQRWDGIRFEAGSEGLLTDATVELVNDQSGTNPVPTLRVENADVILEGTTLADGTGDGLFVVGQAADVTVRRNGLKLSEILRHDQRSVLSSNHADVYLDDVTIFDSGSVGVYTNNFGDIYLRETEIEESGQQGARAYDQGRVIFGFTGRNAGASGQNNFITRSTSQTMRGDLGATLYGGGQGMAFDDNFRHSWFRRGVTNPNERHAWLNGSDAIAECNYWNDGQLSAPGPDLTRVFTSNGGVFDGDPFLTSPPDISTTCGILELTTETNPTARTGSPSVSETAGGPPAGMMPERWWAITQGIENKDPSVGIGHSISAIQRAETPADMRRAYEVAAQLGSDEPHASLEGFLHEQSRRPTHRAHALKARAAIHYGTGRADAARADADALIAEYGETEHARRGWLTHYTLALDAGDKTRAEGALAEVAARWPDYDLAVLREAVAGMASEGTAPRTGEPRAGEPRTGEPRAAGGPVLTRQAQQPVLQATSEALPTVTELRTPYPNPTTGAVTIPLALSEDAEVRLAVVNALGQRVLYRAARRETAGVHALALDTDGLAPGVYVVQVTVAGARTTQFQETFTVVR
ncbi:MAG: T9SS type A sorting domain-containing protein [Bacteroidota bacterium]